MLRVARWESLRVALAFRSIVSTPCFYPELVVFAGCAALWSGGTVLVLVFLEACCACRAASSFGCDLR